MPRGHFLPLGGQKKRGKPYFVDWKIIYFAALASRGQTLPPSENTNKLKKLFLYLKQKGNFGPLEVRKHRKKGFLGPQNNVFCVFWPPKGRKRPLDIKY